MGSIVLRVMPGLLLVAACGDDGAAPDAAAPIDGPADAPDVDAPPVDAIDAIEVDAPVDAPAIDACATRVLFAGGMPPAPQGWSVARTGAATLTEDSPTVTRLVTTTVGTTGAHQLLYLPNAVTPGLPFVMEVELQVVAVNAHNQYDAAVAILGALTPSFGMPAERGQMIYVDAAGVGWADDSGRTAAAAIDGAFHTYRLSVTAAGMATVLRDGVPVLTRAGFVTNGTIAVGDQTNDPNVESTILLRSVSLLCP